MIFTDKKQFLDQLKKRYQHASKPEKKIILDEFTKTTGHERKYAIKLLAGWYQYKQGKIHRPHKRIYSYVDAIILAKVCDLLDWINSKRIQPKIGVAIDSLVGAKDVSKGVKDRLRQQYKMLNLVVLKKHIDAILKRLKPTPVR